VSFGFSGELLGVRGLTVLGELSRMEPGRRKGDWRGLLKESGDGLYGVGVVDCGVLALPVSSLSSQSLSVVPYC
jgi:hypothetical protein